VQAFSVAQHPNKDPIMTTTLIINAILSFAVVVMVVAPLAWAIRTAHRDTPSATLWARLTHARGHHHDGERSPHWRGARGGEAWDAS
jgi:hypothetical protein